jgi:GT2 family glycosyltransferase
MARLTYSSLGNNTILSSVAGEAVEKQKSVAIIIVNWNQKKPLATCLNSLKNKTAYEDYHVIVVDNGSVDGSVEMVKQSFPWADLITLDKNYGFSVGNNKGIDYALKKYNPQYILLLNNDTEIVQSDWLTKMMAVAESEGNVGIVGCKLVYPDGKTQYIGTKITVKGLTWLNPSSEGSLPEVFDIDAVLGACFLIKRDVIDKIGFLDIGFSPFVHEESDFCTRAKKAGYKTRMVLSVRVVHFWKMSVGKVNSAYVECVVRRNAIRFMLLNFPASWLVKRVPVEARIFIGCFIARNKGKKGILPIKLRTGRELLVRLKINVYGWLHNLMSLREILAKRENRTAKLLTSK